MCVLPLLSLWVLGIQSVPLTIMWQRFTYWGFSLVHIGKIFVCMVFFFFFVVFCFLMTCRNTNAENPLVFYVINCILLLHLDFLDKYVLCFWRKMVSFFLNHIHFLMRTNFSVVRNSYLKQCRKYRWAQISQFIK